ncbi:MAG: hypothetical protein OER93_02875 [Thermoleophilia bacterium]|nr:hypothetical protein [Thermoleophilia bacterium]
MRRRGLYALVASALVVAMLGSASLAAAKVHRLFEPAPERVPTGLQVDEDEWSVTPSRVTVAADPTGQVNFSIFNRGEDDHDFAVLDAQGQVRKIDLGPGARGDLAAALAPGQNKIWCNLPGHEALGMVGYITVVDQYDAVYAAWEAEIERMLGRAQ